MKIVAVFNAKGGVAKTTTTVNLGAALAAFGRRVLIIDLDFQANATFSLGVHEMPHKGIHDLINGEAEPEQTVIRTLCPGLDLIGAPDTLITVDIDLAMHDIRSRPMRTVVDRFADRYDIVLFDCPPSLGVMTLNALSAADAVLVPAPPVPYAHDGLLRTWTIVKRLQSRLNRTLRVLTILPTMVRPAETGGGPDTDAGPDRQAQILAAMRAEFGDLVAGFVVPHDVKLFLAATAVGAPAVMLAPKAAASQAYIRAAAILPEALETRDWAAVEDKADGPLDERCRAATLWLDEATAAARREGIIGGDENIPLVAVAQAEEVAGLHHEHDDEELLEDEAAGSGMARAMTLLAAVLTGTVVGFVLGWVLGR